jgi:hypothetical protein
MNHSLVLCGRFGKPTMPKGTRHGYPGLARVKARREGGVSTGVK